MPTTIFDKLLQKSEEIARDRTKQKGIELQQLAVMALLKGIGSPEWEAYMNKFTSNPAELLRLCGKDDTFNQPYQKQNLAYVVSNAICGTATTTGTHLRVETNIDDDPPA